jgi:hypothetical protein
LSIYEMKLSIVMLAIFNVLLSQDAAHRSWGASERGNMCENRLVLHHRGCHCKDSQKQVVVSDAVVVIYWKPSS